MKTIRLLMRCTNCGTGIDLSATETQQVKDTACYGCGVYGRFRPVTQAEEASYRLMGWHALDNMPPLADETWEARKVPPW